ncbi:FAD-binding oxidoreductase [Ancylobacter mangrovi]|uniref:FAD-binding oxidoreductase n=1 Tax=Ancylobacter mangrovi TaxID=2972472 RepID=UPI00216392F6|nr:FAD-binding oxidoreductase [Ancylobacter mangrovi]MCS0502832.1 FAD-binding oxidoreductase [Ancylobacter mangrovi]
MTIGGAGVSVGVRKAAIAAFDADPRATRPRAAHATFATMGEDRLPGGGYPSWWLNEALESEGQVRPCPPLSGMVRTDIAIVGGGFTGLWAALALRERRPDLSVTLIEHEICGAGASGKNAGKVHGYWSSLPRLARLLGPDDAWEMARLGSRAQAAIRAFARDCGRDLWWREGGGLKVSAAPAQDNAVTAAARAMAALGAGHQARLLSRAEVAGICEAPAFRAGIYYPEEATVHPARLVRALRAAALAAGVRIHEHTPMTGLDRAEPSRVSTPGGEIVADAVILARNVGQLGQGELARRFMAFSSYAMMTGPAPERLAGIGWTSDISIVDARSFPHYFRRTPDGRVLMGSGSGPIAYGGHVEATAMTGDAASFARTARGLARLLPALADVPVAGRWGGAIDVSSDRFPFAGLLERGRVAYGLGYSGHGVNPSWILGQCLASLVLGQVDEWTRSPFCARRLPALPPEPARYFAGCAIRRAILACEEAEEEGRGAPAAARAIAALPRLLNLTIGTR